MIVKDFDKKSETAKWLICRMLTFKRTWGWERPEPDFELVIGGVEIDINEFVDSVANSMDETIDRRAGRLAVKKLDDAMMSFSNDIYEIQVETRLKLCELLGVNPEFS